MDEGDDEIIKEIERKYKGNKDIGFLLLKLFRMAIKLRDSDLMALTIDVYTQRGLLDERSLINDARLDYGNPWEYEFAEKKLLLNYKGGIEEVKEVLSKKV
jgi:hypothetical protein